MKNVIILAALVLFCSCRSTHKTVIDDARQGFDYSLSEDWLKQLIAQSVKESHSNSIDSSCFNLQGIFKVYDTSAPADADGKHPVKVEASFTAGSSSVKKENTDDVAVSETTSIDSASAHITLNDSTITHHELESIKTPTPANTLFKYLGIGGLIAMILIGLAFSIKILRK